jgi:hypothetical protein
LNNPRREFATEYPDNIQRERKVGAFSLGSRVLVG